eukprot:GDKI01025369.1.p1 GENE.GDKI01025369.1~~GDKI01025369.1.p1  ORF type:complete len:104 (-),score=7.88 GDKI01025369.1:291-563(-)
MATYPHNYGNGKSRCALCKISDARADTKCPLSSNGLHEWTPACDYCSKLWSELSFEEVCLARKAEEQSAARRARVLAAQAVPPTDSQRER